MVILFGETLMGTCVPQGHYWWGKESYTEKKHGVTGHQ